MPVRQLGRRHFLLGTGGAVLSIPFLSSLAPRAAKAQALDQRFFVAFMTGHGGVWPEHMYPSDGVLSSSHSIYADHTMRWGRLSSSPSGGQVSLSPVLTASSAALPQSLVDKMMIIRGLDVPTYIGHSTAAPLGNYERRDQGPDSQDLYCPTIDQILAAWSGFYTGGDPYVLKSMHVGQNFSWIQRSNGIQAMDPATSPDVLFRTILSTVPAYQPPTQPAPTEPTPTQPAPTPTEPTPTQPAPTPTEPTPTQPAPTQPTPTQPAPTQPTPTQPTPTQQPGESRTHVLNRVVEHFNRLTKGSFGDARRLSANDKARLNDHMDMVADLARRFDAAEPAIAQKANVGAVCDPQAGNTGNTDNKDAMYSPAYGDLRAWHEDYNAVFAAALACGASRLATVRIENTFHHSSNFTIDWEQWHDPVAHQARQSRAHWGSSAEHPQDTLVTAKNNFFRDAYVDLIERLDMIDAGDGTALLDKGLVMWSQESGPVTHEMDSTPVVTAGSVDGYFNTGHYFDLRNRNGSPRVGESFEHPPLLTERRPGILYNQWLSNVLQSMGMSPSEFQRSHPYGWAGYGHAKVDDSSRHPARLKADANQKIPKVTSGT